MKKLLTVFASLIIGTSVVAQIRVTGDMPDPDNLYSPPQEIVAEKKSLNSLAGLYRMSDTIYSHNEKTTFTNLDDNFMMNISEITENNYLATFYGRLKYRDTDIDCGKPSILMFSVNNDGVEISREIVKEGKCKLQKPHRKLRVGWKLENDQLILTKSAGSECVVEPCGKLDRVVYIQKFDKTQ